MTAYYNEIDPFAAKWLKNLIDKGLIAPGDVDERSITEVQPEDLKGYTQCHFFAGIGGWSLALRKGGWSDDTPVWTGSCPCQPFSAIGRRKGTEDERHLWPEFFRLIRELHPDHIFGEQVASKDGYAWFDDVYSDLVSEAYATSAFDLSAAGFGSPQVRQRLYWVANSLSPGLERFTRDVHKSEKPRRDYPFKTGSTPEGSPPASTSKTAGFWADCDWGLVSDKTWRAIEPGSLPLLDGVPKRMDLLRAYGNAIVVPQAAVFVESVKDILLRV